jgi:recombinational DNA repair protein RecR
MADESVIEICSQCGALKYVDGVCQICFLHFRHQKTIDRLIKEIKGYRNDSYTAVS